MCNAQIDCPLVNNETFADNVSTKLAMPITHAALYNNVCSNTLTHKHSSDAIMYVNFIHFCMNV